MFGKSVENATKKLKMTSEEKPKSEYFNKVRPFQPTIKKNLPALPQLDIPSTSAAKMLDRNSNNSKISHMYGPFFLEYSLMAEYVLLQKQRLPGVYVLPSAGSPLKWFGVIFIRHGLYQGGVFKATLYVPDNYPDCDCPILVFEPPIFHPLISSETGELDLKRVFQKWRRNVNYLWQVFQFARHIFYKIDTELAVNQEAAHLYERDTELFKVKVAESISVCMEKLYEKPLTDDPHAIRFSPWEASLHEPIRRRLKLRNADDDDDEMSKGARSSGLSWVQRGTYGIFTKTVS